MAEYTKSNSAGPPTGYYVVGDVVTDMNNVKWVCIETGWPSTFAAQPNISVLGEDLPETADSVGAAASLTGFKSNATGATWTLSVHVTPDGLAHKVTVRNDAAVDHSAKTAILTGLNGTTAVVETINLPIASETVTSVNSFSTLTTIVPSATIGADTMDIGWATLRPTAAAAYRGQFRLEESGSGDILLVCVDGDGAGAYEWKTVTIT